MKVSMEEMRLLAHRSRLALSDGELQAYSLDIGELEELSEALLPYAVQVHAEDAPQELSELREDAVRSGLSAETLLAMAPVRTGDCIKVPCAVKE